MPAKENLVNANLPECQYQKGSIWSAISFRWLNGVLGKGNVQALGIEDLFQPPNSVKSEGLGERLESLWTEEVKETKVGEPSMCRVMWKLFGPRFLKLAFITFLAEIVLRSFVQPLLFGGIIHSLSNLEDDAGTWKLQAHVFGLCLSIIAHTLINHPLSFEQQLVGIRVRVACTSLIYRKVLKLSQVSGPQSSVGSLVNLLSNDLSRFDRTSLLIFHIWIGPVQAIVTTWILWWYYDFGLTCLVGLLACSTFAAVQGGCMGKLFAGMRRAISKKMDVRVNLMSEVFGGIKLIKLSAWEEPISKWIGAARGAEIHAKSRLNLLRAFNLSLAYTSPKFVIFLLLLSRSIWGRTPISSEMVFVTLFLYNNLKNSLATLFPYAVFFVSDTFESLRRVQEFLLIEQVKEKEELPIANNENASVKIDNMCCKWASEQEGNTLSHVTLSLKQGECFLVFGPVGSGKSSLLQSLLGELASFSGSVEVYGSVSYSSQDPWIFSGTLRDNILFKKKFHPSRYSQVVDACSLQTDFDSLPNGEMSLVGERGTSLSGGQKCRISLARAIYAEADVYLLDDPLSSVDAEVARHILDRCIFKFLRNKTRILVTHQVNLIHTSESSSHFDQVVVMKKGAIQTHAVGPSAVKKAIVASLKKDATEEGFQFRSDCSKTHVNDDDVQPVHRQWSNGGQRREDLGPEQKKFGARKENQTAETINVESIRSELYLVYLKSGGGILTWISLAALSILTHVLLVSSDWWLKIWTSDFKDQSRPLQLNDYHFEISVYTILVTTVFIVFFVRTVMFLQVCSAASTRLFERLCSSLLRAPMRFYETTPIGNILSRVSRDIGSIDEVLPLTMFDAVQIFLAGVGSLLAVVMVNQSLITPLLILVPAFWYLEGIYLRVSRSLKRIESRTRSPIYSHVSTTLLGLSTIRATGSQGQMTKQFEEYQDMHSSAFFTYIAISRWFRIWVDWICVAFVICVIVILTLVEPDGASFGMAISTAMTLIGVLHNGVKNFSEVENQMVAVERVIEYIDISPEAAMIKPEEEKVLPQNWPSQGRITFDIPELRYHQDNNNEPPVLRNISLEILSGEKIGIVGRTGAGKSSLTSCLFRLVEPSEGSRIEIDGVDIMQIGLKLLRSKISIIPQDPTLFNATLRMNLDPSGRTEDRVLWNALEDVQLTDCVRGLGKGLNSEIPTGGGNFSVGQRQLLCLARAMLQNNRILVLDEAPANVDKETDLLIQHSIRTKFADCTVITVAHRLNTVLDCDRILVLDAGRIIQYDSPRNLLKEEEGMFFKLAMEGGALEGVRKRMN